ncbi:hypothetical protein [Sediminispirochaeta bajacaliforniensis]|uniref:hypothetical protein n=1 Tax=Sediminispirochaeta bajacaliforniensis TaxID=148 RepID=UPI0003694E8F|nr:hypothetical protein [Sediminispirochaeta bajacaliforniensis]
MEDIKRFRVKKQEKDDDVYFSIAWSHLTKAERYTILGSAPSMAGVYELYYREPGGALKQLFFQMAWYGGIREHLRRDIDPTLLDDAPIQKAIVEVNSCFFRYSLMEDIHDMEDLCFFFSRKAPPDKKELPSHSGRYRKIYVREIDSDRLVTF